MALTTFQQLRDLTARLNRYRHEYHDLKAPSVTDEDYNRVLDSVYTRRRNCDRMETS